MPALFNGHMGDFLDDLRDRLHDWVEDLQFSAIHKRALLAVFAVVCVLSAAVVARGHSQPVVEPTPIVIAPPKVTVDVAGGVKNPGVYELPADSRVMDAITAAGGTKPGTDTSDINLARIVKDGEQIYVETPEVQVAHSQFAPTHVTKKKSGPININRATATELDSLPGIGPVIAARIIDYRKANGPFLSVDDLQKVSGIGSAKFAQFKSKVRV
jgi:competence protein ComEA